MENGMYYDGEYPLTMGNETLQGAGNFGLISYTGYVVDCCDDKIEMATQAQQDLWGKDCLVRNYITYIVSHTRSVR